MRLPPRGAQRASLCRPIILAALVLASVGVVTVTAPSTTTEAGSSCSGWRSRTNPPTTIRVLRTGSGRVDRVNFRKYVGIVMASGEWPTWMARASLEVGATAVKQYAWYYALRGHHRDWYRTRSGGCYDVRDDTNDQLYRPSHRPSSKQLRAIAVTWALTLRKGNRFFLTGYRSGNRVRCARDADGWHLYQASVEDCARRGWSRARIQRAYYMPRLNFSWSRDAIRPKPDRVDPDVTAPRLTLLRGSTLGDGIAQVAWKGSDGGGRGISGYQLQRRSDAGSWREVRLDRARSTRARLAIGALRTQQFRVRATDHAGNRSSWQVSGSYSRKLVESNAAELTGGWSPVRDAAASDGGLVSAAHPGSSIRYVMNGRAVAIVAPTGPHRGRATILVDGKVVVTISLRTPDKHARRLVWSRAWSKPGRHVIKLVVTGASTSRARVAVDAFAVVQ